MSWLALPTSARERWLAVLVAFLDESGSHDATGKLPGSEILGIGGVVARTEVWERIEAMWLDVLKRYQVPVFHMTECDSLKGDFFQWSRIQADALINELLDCFLGSPAFLVCGTVLVKDYDEMLPELLKEQVVRHPYHAALHACIGRILGRLPPHFNESVGFVLDRQEEFSKYAIEGFEHLRRESGDRRIGSVTYDDKAQRIPLQVADIVANVMTRHMRLEQKRPGPPEYWMQRLLKHPHCDLAQFERREFEIFVAGMLVIGAQQFPPKWNP